MEEAVSFPFLSSSLPFISKYILTYSLSGFGLGIRLKHIYNESGVENLFLIITNKSSPLKSQVEVK